MTRDTLQQRFNQLNALILQRQAFEAAHPYPPYSQHKTDFNFTDVHGNSLLHYAAALGDMAKIRECLKNNIDIDLKNNQSQQALHLALENRQLEAAKTLFMQGTECRDVNLTHCEGDPEQTAWLREEIQQSLQAAFPIPTLNYRVPRYEGQFFKLGKQNDAKPQGLTRAAEIGHIPWIESVITHHRVPQKSINALLPIAAASHQLDMVKYLMEERKVTCPPYGKTALTEAVKHRSTAVIDYLLTQKRSDINQPDDLKNTALSYAVANNDKQTTDNLLKQGATCGHVNLSGNTLMHIAVNTRCSYLKDLLELPEFNALRHTRNIYGFTPLDLALQTSQDDFIQLLAPELDLAQAKKMPTYGVKPGPVNQSPVLDNMVYRLKLKYRDTRYFNLNGHCNGFAFLYSLYADKTPYYLDTLALMSSWNGSEDDLMKPFSPHWPQAKYYHNLDELFEQWTNDVIWFQHSKLQPVDSLHQDSRAEQFDLIKSRSEGNNRYIPLYTEPARNQDEHHYERNEAQFVEILCYVMRMPAKIHLEFTGGNHATSGYKTEGGTLAYYDCNWTFKAENNPNALDVTRKLLDWYDGFDGKACCTLNIYCFQKDLNELTLPEFFVFNDKELPKSREQARGFQRLSDNQFTPLHIAVMTRSLPAVKKLLTDGFCDLHARDCSGRSAIKMAIDSHFDDALVLFLNQPEIHLTEFSAFIHEAYRTNQTAILDSALANPKIKNLISLLFQAIHQEDLPFVKRLLSDVKMPVNQLAAFTLPLIEALQVDNPHIIQALLNHDANLFIPCGYAKTPLKVAFQKHLSCLGIVIAHLKKDINRRDDCGMAAIHHATEYANAEALRQLIKAGADVKGTSATGKTVFDWLANALWVDDDLRECYRLLISQYQFDLSNASDRNILQHLLVTLAFAYDEGLYRLLLKQCSAELIDGLLIEGKPFLHHLIASGCGAPLALLLASGASIDLTSNDGNTPLMTLIQADNLPHQHDLIDLFIHYNANVTIKNTAGKSANDLMRESHDEQIRQILVDYGLEESIESPLSLDNGLRACHQ